MDIFDLIGPIMVGPSKLAYGGRGAHRTCRAAGAWRGAGAGGLLPHGSFADTGRGHGTDRALIAGLLGMEPDDSRIPDSFDHAAEHGLKFEFGTCTLREAHPNNVLAARNGRQRKARQGRRRVDRRRADTDTAIKRYAAVLLRRAPTLIVNNEDQPSGVADVSRRWPITG